jgi:hypothetical protein
MNSKFWMVLSTSLLAVLGVGIGNPSSSNAQPVQNHSKAVIIQCVVNTGPPEGGGPIVLQVFASSSSPGAPVPAGSECAQALASVLAAGFQLNNVVVSAYGPQYTLIK